MPGEARGEEQGNDQTECRGGGFLSAGVVWWMAEQRGWEHGNLAQACGTIRGGVVAMGVALLGDVGALQLVHNRGTQHITAMATLLQVCNPAIVPKSTPLAWHGCHAP
jgi:hypothetical protein